MITSIFGKVQNYDWGKVDQGTVYEVVKSFNTQLSKNQKYAEYWMGTHKNACSTLPNNELLSTITNLPFLFKILSVNKALSIQAHPDKELAIKLHRSNPTNYKDDNHKPEMCICITNEFEALSGFCSESQFAKNCQEIPEIINIIGTGSFKSQFAQLMTCSSQQIETQIHALQARNTHSPLVSLILVLNQQYPNDVGVFCPVFMNHVKLNKYEALFMAANEPHAYLKGDCIECMANSDNVVRAGLTPKFRDVDNLLSMLTYKRYEIKDLLVQPVQKGKLWHYASPVSEFDVYKIELTTGQDGSIQS